MKSRPLSLCPELVPAVLSGRKTMTRRPMAADVRPLSVIPYNTPGVTMLGMNARPVREWFTVPDETSARLWWARPGVRAKPTAADLRRGRRWTQDAIEQHGSCRWTADELSGLCPLGMVGDNLWLRERARVVEGLHKARWPDGLVGPCIRVRYEATGNEADVPYPDRMSWIPRVGHCIPNGVHKEGSRWSGVIVEVRVERLHDITEEDARAEGIERISHVGPLRAFGWKDYGGGHGFFDPRKSFQSLWRRLYGPGTWEANPLVWVVRWKPTPA